MIEEIDAEKICNIHLFFSEILFHLKFLFLYIT